MPFQWIIRSRLPLKRVRFRVSEMSSRIRGEFIAASVVVTCAVLDIWISHNHRQWFPPECCAPSAHMGNVITSVGVAVAFVLTYLAALTGLPSPGRQLLSSALGHIKLDAPDLAAIDEDGRISHEEFQSLQAFITNARDLAPTDLQVSAACESFMLVVNLAKPQHIRPRPEASDLRKLGYSFLRAHFLSSFVFKKDAEKCWLLATTLFCGIIFSYVTASYFFETVKIVEFSKFIFIAYPTLAVIGAAFSVAMILRMWPHAVEDEVLKPALAPLAAAWRQRVEALVNKIPSPP